AASLAPLHSFPTRRSSDLGSFTGAAGRLEMSAVMVGKYIALLESQLGTRLLERNTRRQSLTDAGRVYFDEAKRVLEQVSIAESRSEEHTSELQSRENLVCR